MGYIEQAFASNFIAPVGPQLNQFEERFCELTGFSAAVAVSSGTAAMHLALRELGVGKGDMVLASTLTFIGSVSPVSFLGAETVFIDSDRETWNMDPALLEEEITSMEKEGRLPKAVIPTDLYGQSCDIDSILAVCEPRSVPVVIDSAEALGATYRGRSAGYGSKAAVFSFNGNKIITTSGGGLLASDDADLIARARHLSTQARVPVAHFEHEEIGYNYRMSNILAAIGLGQLDVLAERVKRKREIFQRYSELLSALPGITMMPEADYGEANRWLTVVLIDSGQFGVDREVVRLALEQFNIESRPMWKPMHSQPVYRDCKVVGGGVAEDLFEKGLCLPSGTGLIDSDLERIVEIIKKCGDKN